MFFFFSLTWSLLAFATRVEQVYAKCVQIGLSADWQGMLAQKQALLVQMVNQARPIPPPTGVTEKNILFQKFHDLFAQVLHALHDYYSSVAAPNLQINEYEMAMSLQAFGDGLLRHCLMAFQVRAVFFRIVRHDVIFC